MTIGAPLARRAASTAPVLRTSSWPAVAGWGAALLQLALGAGALTGAGGVWLGVAGATLAILGAGGLVWGAATLARGRIVVPRVGVAGALGGIAAATVVLMLDPLRTSVVAVAAASALLIAAGIGCGIAVRRGPAGRATRTGVLGLLVAAVLVAGVVTPALGATEAGRLAPSHTGHDLIFDEHQH
ncbi:hypothetical protein [uncultured Microbacterium sp.]|uniref:hypothetical protein n=1 Tax=uncultured Microbacterium sp. TaxID=191216 RepID=UPI0035CAE19A